MPTDDFSMGPASVVIEGLVHDAMGLPNPAGADGGHYPYARQVRLCWHADAAGHWASAGLDEHLWEVFCAQCGDTDGPVQNQEPAVRQLRGPYHGKHHATHVATKHFEAWRR